MLSASKDPLACGSVHGSGWLLSGKAVSYDSVQTKQRALTSHDYNHVADRHLKQRSQTKVRESRCLVYEDVTKLGRPGLVPGKGHVVDSGEDEAMSRS
jgi:hypothetical protein